MIFSTLSFAIMNALVKILEDLPTFQLVFFRSMGSLILATTYIMYRRIPILGKGKGILMTRALLGLTAMSLFFMSTKYLPVGTAVSLRYLSPIFAAVFAVFILGEKLRAIQYVLFAIAFGGVVLLKGFDTSISMIGLGLIIGASIFSGMVYVVLRKIGASENPLVVVNYFMFFGTVIGGLLMLPGWVAPHAQDWKFLAGLGIFGFFGQLFMTKAFQLARTSMVAPLKYVEVVFTLFIGVVMFSEKYTFLGLLGISLIILALVLNAFVKQRA